MNTIKYLLAAAFFIVSVNGIRAQSNYGEFRWGLKAGANFANASNSDNIEKDKGKTGFVGGAFCKIPLKFYLSIRPELLFAMKGASFNIPSDVPGQTDNVEYSLNYLEMPVSVDFDLPYFLDLHAGIQGAILLSNESDSIEKGEFGWHAGTGIDLGNLGIHVRYHQSLTPFYDGTTYGAGKVEMKNWGITLTAAYMFP